MTRQHGTYACAQYGPEGKSTDRQPCKCEACKAARRDYMRAYRAAGRDRWVNEHRRQCVRGLGWPR